MSGGYQLRIDLAGITFTSPACDTKQEAEALKSIFLNSADADNVGVEER